MVLTERHDVLDHGYLEHVEHWGSDERIVETARMSTDGGFVSWDAYEGHPKGDAGLLRYLYENKHASPFEFAGLTIEVKAPIFIFRQWHRHRTQAYNEMSARYTPLPEENYLPTVDRCIVVPGNNKQARGTSELVPNHGQVLLWLEHLEDVYIAAQAVYQRGLDMGIPKEIARLPVPVSRYSVMRATGNLRNWLAFLTLRMDSHAQWEIRQYAETVGMIIEKAYPRTWELFVKGRGQ